jgi:hypothetical protein
MLRLSMLPLALLAFTACKHEVACDDMAAVSVGVTVQDEAGNLVDDAIVTWDAGDGAQACDSIEPGKYLCAYEVDGDITIHVSADGFEDQEHVVTVGADECHVTEEFLTVSLASVDCTAVEVPAVNVTVAGSGGEDLSDVVVEWDLPTADMEAVPCDVQADGSWDCAADRGGDIEVFASAAGHETDIQTVTVPMDEADCHPVTQHLDFELDWLPD